MRGRTRERRFRRFSSVTGALLLAVGSCLSRTVPADAGDVSNISISSGTDITRNSRSGYAGGIWSPAGTLDSSGFRIKALGGYGAYAYDSSLPLSGGLVPMRFHGDYIFADLMGGWQLRRGEWTLKGYAGIQFIQHSLRPDDPANDVKGAKWSGKGQLELWRNLGSGSWLSVDASYATAFGDYWMQGRLGRRLAPRWSVGLEGGGLGNEDYDAARGGVFVRLHTGKAEVTLSGGATGDYRGEDTSGYVTLGLYRRR